MNFIEKMTEKHKSELSLFIKEKERRGSEIKRALAVLLVSQGIEEELILISTGLKRKTAIKLRKKFIKYGTEILQSKKKEKEPRSLLTKSQRTEIAHMLNTKTPRDYGWSWGYWTPSILAQLILDVFGVKYKSKTSIYIIFKQSKFTYHKPDKIYKNRDQSAVDKWKEENTPIIQAALQDPETILVVEDEMIITSQTTTQKIWLPQGSTHSIECSNTRKRRSIYGFLNIKTGEQFAFKTEKQTSDISAKILKKVLDTYKGKKVLLFWDNAPWHKGESMREFLKTCSNFTIIPFPPYAPDLNPQEHVWKAGRAHATHNKFISDIDKAVRQLLDYLNNSIFKYELLGFTSPL